MKNEKIEKFERDMLLGENLRITKKKGNTSYKLHWHSYYEIIHYKNCHGTCVLNGKNFDIDDNCIFFLTPKDFHEIKNDNNPDQEYVNLSFSENIVESRIIKEISVCPMVVYSPPKELTDIINLIYSVQNSENNELSDIKVSSLLNYILCEIITHGEKINSSCKYISPQIGNAIAGIISDPTRKITLKDIAARAKMSQAYFSDLFHKETGTSFIKYLNSLRIEHAKRLLEQEDMAIVDICFESGFNTLSHFIRTFGKYEGMSPSEYRKSKKVISATQT